MSDDSKFIKISKLISKGNYNKAIDIYNEIIKNNPTHEGAKEGLGRLYLTIGEKTKAMEYLGENIDNSLSDSELIDKLLEIKDLINNGTEKTIVIKKYKELLESYPEHVGIKEGYELYLKENS